MDGSSVLSIMKTTVKIIALIFLLLTVCSQGFAMISVEFVSRERAKELGVTFKKNSDGEAGVKVWMEFKSQGELEKITYIQLQVGEGKDRIMSAPLQVSHPSTGIVSVNFSAFPAYLAQSSFMIVVYNGPKGDVGYRFMVKDFVELK
jgi:hypothetical protein